MLPDEIAEALASAPMCQFATTTRAGAPINTELLLEVGSGGTLDVSTGVAYPAKAERARRDPRVGLWIEAPDGPVVSVAALAAVRDADIAMNAERYVSRWGEMIRGLPGGDDDDVVGAAVWYWSRIYVECHPVSLAWWPSLDALDREPTRWVADPAPHPASDPAPTGPPTRAEVRSSGDWRKRASAAVSSGVPAHLTTVDRHGSPLPRRVAARPSADGFELDEHAVLPQVGPGPACLTFGGLATFLGTWAPGSMTVERMLPDLVLVADTAQILHPSDETRTRLMGRLRDELARRGQAVPEPVGRGASG